MSGNQVTGLGSDVFASRSLLHLQDSASKSSIRKFVITEKAPTRAFSWLKAATTAFTFETLLSHYAKRTPSDDRVRGVLQPRPGQHTSTPLAAEVTPSHNRQPAARLCHVSRVTRPCQYYHHNAQPQVMHLSRLHHHQPSPARWWLAIRPGSQ